MKPRSSRNKGARFENYLVDVFRSQLDEKTHRNYASGGGLDKADIRLPSFNVEIEAKNCAQIAFVEWWEQAKRQKTQGNIQVLAFRYPKKAEFQETIICMDLGDFIELMKKQKDEVKITSNFSPAMKYKGDKVVVAIKDFLKELSN